MPLQAQLMAGSQSSSLWAMFKAGLGLVPKWLWLSSLLLPVQERIGKLQLPCL
jgi:hypothetical protein